MTTTPQTCTDSFPLHEWPEGIRPSEQLMILFTSDSTYRLNVLRMLELLKKGATVVAFQKHEHIGLRKLGNWFKDRKKSFQRVVNRGNSPELDVWPNIAWHMGPCPLQGKQASVHRTDDLKGYRLGNLEWASKRTQALDKATGTRKTYWQGKQVSDRELVQTLMAVGVTCTENRIAQFRKNNKAKFSSQEALSKAMLQKWGAYEASRASPASLIPDFYGEAPLEKGLKSLDEWDVLLKARAYLNKPPLEIQLVIAYEMEKDFLWGVTHPENGYTLRLQKKLDAIQTFIRRVRQRLDDLATKRLSATEKLVTLGLEKEISFHLQPSGFEMPAPPPKPKFAPAPPPQVAEEDKPMPPMSGEKFAKHLKELRIT